MLAESAVVDAWEYVTNNVTSGAGTELLVAELAETQPLIAGFVAEAAAHFEDEDASELLYFIALVAWQACRAAGFAAEVAAEPLERSYRAAEAWGQGLGGASGAAIIAEKRIRDYRAYAEPYLMAFAIEAILDCVDDGLEIRPDDQERALIASKAIIDALVLSRSNS
jgi:hypothetical protein